MAVNIYTEKDADMSFLEGKTVGMIGYGSQGHAHALNLHDSGVKVMVGLYEGSASRQVARDAGLAVGSVAEVAQEADVMMVAIPDHVQKDVYRDEIEPNLGPGKALMFAHGFTIHYQFVVPPPSVDVMMVRPESAGPPDAGALRGAGHRRAVPAGHSPGTPPATPKNIGLAYASGIGCARAGVLETTFKDETESDLFGEQSVLCGGVTALINLAFETLVERGYPPEIAYFECLHELKMIVDLIQQGGFNYMRYSVSDTAEYGDLNPGHAGGGRPRPREHAPGAGRHPERLLRPGMDGGVRRGTAQLPAPAPGSPHQPDPRGGPGPARNDAVDESAGD